MAQFNVTITVPDNTVTAALAGLKLVRPANAGENDLNYLKRVTKDLLYETSQQGMIIIARQALGISDPGITTS